MRWTPDDVVRTPCREAWLQAGIMAALESPALARLRGPLGKRLRRLAAAKALALAFTHHFGERGKTAHVLGEAAAAPAITALALENSTAWVAPEWVSARENIRRLRRCGWETQPIAAVPWPLREALEPRRDDFLLFGLVLALDAPTPAEAQRARAAGFPVQVLHWLPSSWQQPCYGGVHLKIKAEQALTVHLHGQANGQPAHTTLALQGDQTAEVALPWERLTALTVNRWPEGRVGLAQPHRRPLVIAPHQWENIALYGMEIWLLGFLPWKDFWRSAHYLRRGSRTFPHGIHFSPAYGVHWQALHPLCEI